MDTAKLEKWANMLLDTGKRNNLINFKDTKASTLEVVLPSSDDFFSKVDSSVPFEVYDPKLSDYDLEEEEESGEKREAKMNKEDYIGKYSPRIKKSSQVLLYNPDINPITALKNIDKKAREHLEETGVNVAYIAFGFIHWKDSENSQILYNAPVLLVPVTFTNESSISPWFIKMTEDEVVVNPTFSFKLDNEYGIKLPEYEDEGLSEYLNKIRGKINKLGWTVSDDAKIGIFSFLKLNMYKDLQDNKDEILQKDNVRLLLGEPVESGEVIYDYEQEHRVENPLIELHNVVDADSSQLEAIQMAKAGKSFVLQGPPGTGKSQTITNIIAECISDGKKVLFVSEKQAALNVVYDKLKKAGLEEFCLELHSHKTNKKDVIAELCKTLKANKTTVSSKANDILESKARNQKVLDQYEKELHVQRDVINLSLFQLYEAYASCRTAPDFNVFIKDIGLKGEDYLKSAINLLSQYVDFVPTIGLNYKKNAWYGYNNQDTSYQNREKLITSIRELIEIIEALLVLKKNIYNSYEISIDNFRSLKDWIVFFDLVADSDILIPDVYNVSDFNFLYERLNDLKKKSSEIIAIRDLIEVEYDSSIYPKINGKETYNKLVNQYSSGISRLFSSDYKNIIEKIRLVRKDQKKPSYEMAVQIIKLLSDIQEKADEFNQLEQPIKGGLGKAYKGVHSDWTKISDDLEKYKTCRSANFNCKNLGTKSLEEYETIRQQFKQIANQLKDLENRGKDSIDFIANSFDASVFDIYNLEFDIALRKLKVYDSEFDRIDNWCAFNLLLSKMKNADLVSFIDEAIKVDLDTKDVVISYKRNFYKQWIDLVLHTSPALYGFNRIAHEKNVEEFANQDKTQFEISKARIKSEISSKRPSVEMIASGSAVSLLLREGEKKRKQKGIRALMEEAGELIQILKPCFLMSPLSVSTFLNPETIRFDTVVFDEASQIFPQDAIGAIYRGKQLIVVGDSKQMPPTNFFNASADVEDDEETGDITDFESILDLCSTTFPQRRLRWHYRSKFEQLISFSNKNFYDNDLITFPSSIMDKKWIGVDYYFVDGIFDHKSRSNRAEAEFIVDLIYKNIEKYPERSLGVVAFSVAQQDLIDRLLSKRRIEDPSKEEFFRKTLKEPFFIKNLETVQGDERDTIIFSVAYAKDATGKLMHNFGPLNRVGGERRLNVAITRAKMNVQLVSSIHSTDIDLKRTSAEGARLLREYLDYAENGAIALERTITVDTFEQFDSEFEKEVCEFLRDNGFSVDMQVGCSNFRIDIGLKRPGTSDYVLAIECDGATYHSSKNARDRDRLRQQILENMGWKFYRIWSTDWFKNNAIEKERLLEAAKEALNAGNAVNITNSNEESEEENEESQEFSEEVAEKNVVFPIYRTRSMLSTSTYSATSFQNDLRRVLEVESPLSEEWLLKRISWLFGREKVTSYVTGEYEKLMVRCNLNGIIRGKDGFLYFKDQTDVPFRIPGEFGEKRDIKYISDRELASGLYEVIKENMSVDRMGAYKFLAGQLGFQRVTENMVSRFDDSLKLLKSVTIVDGEMISIVNKEQ